MRFPSVMNSWVGSLSTFGQNLRYGGPQVVVFAIVVAVFIQWVMALGISELASAFPSSGASWLLHTAYALGKPNVSIGSISLHVYACTGEIQAVQRLRHRLDVDSSLVACDNVGVIPGRNRIHWPSCFRESKLYTSSMAHLPVLSRDGLYRWYVDKSDLTFSILIANSDSALLILKVASRHHICIHVSELDWFLDLVHLYASHETAHQRRFVYCRIRPRYQWLESRNSMGPRNLKRYVLLCRVGFSHTHCRRDREPGPQVTCRHVSIPLPRVLKFSWRNWIVILQCSSASWPACLLWLPPCLPPPTIPRSWMPGFLPWSLSIRQLAIAHWRCSWVACSSW